MKRLVVQTGSLLGFLMALCGTLYATTSRLGLARTNWWRVGGAGWILMGLTTMLLARPPLVPEFVPEIGRRLGYGLGVLMVLIGAVILLLSWL